MQFHIFSYSIEAVEENNFNTSQIFRLCDLFLFIIKERKRKIDRVITNNCSSLILRQNLLFSLSRQKNFEVLNYKKTINFIYYKNCFVNDF